MNTKEIIRNSTKTIRNSLETAFVLKISDAIVNNIKNWDLYKKALNVMIFYPLGSEISLLKLLKDESKTFYFPVVNGTDMYPVKYDIKNGFKKGRYGIMEPVGNKLQNYSDLDLIFTPALSVDKCGYRIGYGGGYYDRFFEYINEEVFKIVPIYSKFFVESINPEKYDFPVDFVITEQGIQKANHVNVDCLVCQYP